MNITIPVVGPCQLTTDHPSSSYNIPVLVRDDDNQVLGPSDVVGSQSVADWVRSSSQWTGAANEPWDADTCAALIRFGVQDVQIVEVERV